MIIDLAIENTEKLPKDLLAMIGHILVEDQNHLQALQVFEKIKDDKDIKIQAGYLSALAEKDAKAASEFSESCEFQPPTPESEDDLRALLEAPLEVKKDKKEKAAMKTDTKAGTKKIFIPEEKPKKKVKYPKSYDPENPGPMPDPERWVPKWLRSKGKKKLRLKGPQGDIKNIGMHNKKEHTTANMEASTGAGGKRKK